VIIVDGLSTDQSIEVARRARPDCRLVIQKKKGKGAAIRAGLAAARGEYVIFLDADYSHDPAEITQMLARLQDGYDLVSGSRFISGGGSADLTMLRLIGNKFFVWMANALHGSKYTDVLYGYLGMRREVLLRLPIAADNMEIDLDVRIAAHRAGMQAVDVPSFERPRYSGHSRLRPLRDGLKILWKIVRTH
jgi:glycosyltransferase involved in cell wall biosynthesis